MSGEPLLRVEDLPPLAGRPGVAQGGYGSRGNLELVCPDPVTGFWVLWWNADAADDDARSGARPGAWSGGLHVPTGVRHDAAAITQLRRGPRFLEVVLAGRAGLHRTTWSPDAGFASASRLSATPVLSASAVVEPPLGDALHLLVAEDDGVRHLHGDAGHYADLTWGSTPVPAAGSAVALAPAGAEGLLAVVAEPTGVVLLRWTPRGGWVRGAEVAGTADVREVALAGDLVLGLRADGSLLALRLDGDDVAPAAAPELVADAVTAAPSTVDGGRVEVVVRSGAALQHLWTCADGAWRPAVPVRSEVWADPGLATVHRRST